MRAPLLVGCACVANIVICVGLDTARASVSHCGGPSQRDWWEAPPVDPSAMLFFSHIAHTGGTAMSWRLEASWPKGRVVPGSQPSGRFRPGRDAVGRLVDSAAEVAWATGNQSTYRVSFGHNPPSDASLAAFGGALQTVTLLRRPLDHQAHFARGWVCPRYARIFLPWWGNGGGGADGKQTGEVALLDKMFPSDGAADVRHVAPEPVVRYCPPRAIRHGDPQEGRGPATYQASFIQKPAANSARGTLGAVEAPCVVLPDKRSGSPGGGDSSDPGEAAEHARALEGMQVTAGALGTLASMPWFGLLERWVGSVCLFHYATEWPWPNETAASCGSGPSSAPALEELKHEAFTGHWGRKPGARSKSGDRAADDSGESWSACPVRAAERYLERSPVRSFAQWAKEHDPDVVRLLFEKPTLPSFTGGKQLSAATASKPSSASSSASSIKPTERRKEARLSAQVGSPFEGLLGGGVFGDQNFSHGPDAVLYGWAEAAFARRVEAAALDLRRRGICLSADGSTVRMPPFLSSECFARPPPDGFGIESGL